MSEPKFAQFDILCGTNGTGKSTFGNKTLQMLSRHYKNCLIRVQSEDLPQNPFKHYPLTTLRQYAGGFACVDADEMPFDNFLMGLGRYRNGIIVLDEAGLEVPQSGEPSMPLKRLLKQRRKINVTVIFMYHSVSEINTQLFKWCNNVILFHQTDKFNHKGAVVPRIDDLNAAKDRIEKRYLAALDGKGPALDKYYCERIKLS